MSLKYAEGQRVRLGAFEDPHQPEQDATILTATEMSWGDSYIVQVEPADDEDDGLREVTEDQILEVLK